MKGKINAREELQQEIEDKLNYYSQSPMISGKTNTIEEKWKQRMDVLKSTLPMEEILAYADYLETIYTELSILHPKYVESLSRLFEEASSVHESLKNMLSKIQKSLREKRRTSQKEVIKTMHFHLRGKQSWSNGTPAEQLNTLELSSEEEKKFKDTLFKIHIHT